MTRKHLALLGSISADNVSKPKLKFSCNPLGVIALDTIIKNTQKSLMRIKDAKNIIEDEIKILTKHSGLKFNRKEFCLSFKNNDYNIDFNIFVDNSFGKGIEIFSECVITLDLIKGFYKELGIPTNENSVSFGNDTQELYDYFKNKIVIKDKRVLIEYNDNVKQNLIDYVNEFIPKLLFVFDSILFELDNNLKDNFDSKDNHFFKFYLFDKIVLYHFFKPGKLPEALQHAKKIMENGEIDVASYKKYLIFIPKICELNHLNYSDYQPKLPFFRRIKFYFNSIDTVS